MAFTMAVLKFRPPAAALLGFPLWKKTYRSYALAVPAVLKTSSPT